MLESNAHMNENGTNEGLRAKDNKSTATLSASQELAAGGGILDPKAMVEEVMSRFRATEALEMDVTRLQEKIRVTQSKFATLSAKLEETIKGNDDDDSRHDRRVSSTETIKETHDLNHVQKKTAATCGDAENDDAATKTKSPTTVSPAEQRRLLRISHGESSEPPKATHDEAPEEDVLSEEARAEREKELPLDVLITVRPGDADLVEEQERLDKLNADMEFRVHQVFLF
jgi:hypothetical protein